jgi:hypothetical protein
MLFGAVAFAVCLVALARALQVFGTDSAHVQFFNSDSALPVLMANDPVIDPFRTYIYGQDQFGAWPYLAAQLFRRATGFVWTDHAVFVWQTCWLFLSVPLVWRLTRTRRAFAAVLFLLVLCLHQAAGSYIFVINQRYAWQITALFFSWLGLRRVCEGLFRLSERGRISVVAWHAALYWFAFLSVWISPVSIAMLGVLSLLELLRAHLMRPVAAAARRPAKLSFALVALPLVAAIISESLLRLNFYRFSLKHYGRDYRTPTGLDRGHLLENLRTQLANYTESAWWPLGALALVASVAFVALLIRAALNSRASARSRFATDAFALDIGVLATGSCAVAAINFAVSVAFVWFRLNAFGPRYLALTHLFGAFGGLLFAALGLSLLTPLRRDPHPLLRHAPTLASLALLILFFPPARKDATYAPLKRIASTLAQKSPAGLVLLGGYWETYVFAALESPGAIIPVPAEDQYVRTPWTPQRLREAREVVVVQNAYQNFGGRETPQPVITQHGATLTLVEPRWYASDGYVFSLYRNERAVENR